jgi:hypothetical protein
MAHMIDEGHCCKCSGNVSARDSYSWDYVLCDVYSRGTRYETRGNLMSVIESLSFEKPEHLRLALCAPCLLRMCRRYYATWTLVVGGLIATVAALVAVGLSDTIKSAHGTNIGWNDRATVALSIGLGVAGLASWATGYGLWRRYSRFKENSGFDSDDQARSASDSEKFLLNIAQGEAVRLGKMRAIPVEEWRSMRSHNSSL